jgi:hypothetical protein
VEVVVVELAAPAVVVVAEPVAGGAWGAGAGGGEVLATVAGGVPVLGLPRTVVVDAGTVTTGATGTAVAGGSGSGRTAM